MVDSVAGEGEGMGSSSKHILVFPFPAEGHMIPLPDLTNQLALRGLSIIIVTPKNLPTLSPILSAHPSTIDTLVLPLPSHPKLPPGAEHIRDTGVSGTPLFMAALTVLSPLIAAWFHSHPSPPHAILSDFFLGWTLRLAQDLNIPRIAFYSSGSFLASVVTALYSDVARFKALPPDHIELAQLPRSPVFKEHHLPSTFRVYNESNPASKALKDGLSANLSSRACVFNSFHALEGDYLEHFRKKQTLTGRVFAVGPLSLFSSLPRLHHDDDDLLRCWLQGCPDASVLYVSFWIQKQLSQPQQQALAQALHKSGTRFVWLIPPGEATHLHGSEGRRYMVKGWAPQVELLGHRAVGGFLSHCGWNSTLESAAAAVPILGWPMVADQYVNARLLVHDIGVAVMACEGSDTVPDPDNLAQVIQAAMALDAPQKRRARDLKDKAVAAVRDGGSSALDLDHFVNHLRTALHNFHTIIIM